MLFPHIEVALTCGKICSTTVTGDYYGAVWCMAYPYLVM